MMRFVLFVSMSLLAAATVLPPAWLFAESMGAQNIWAIVAQAVQGDALMHSLTLAFTVAAATTSAGTALAIGTAKRVLPGARWLIGVLLVPLLLPPYLLAYGWYETLGPRPSLFGFWGTAGVLSTVYLPIPTLLGLVFLRRLDPALEMAALLAGGWPVVLRRITIPLLMPGIALAFLIVFVLAFGEQSVASFLHYDVYALRSFTAFSAFYDVSGATALALLPAGIALAAAVAASAAVRTFSAHFSRRHRPLTMDVRFGWVFSALTAVFAVFSVGVPLWHLFLRAVRSDEWYATLSFAAAPAWHSLLYAFAAGILFAAGGFTVAWCAYRRCFGARPYMFALLFTFALPSAVVAIAMIVFYNTLDWLPIYATPVIVLLATAAKYLLLSAGIVYTALIQLPPSQIEAARTLGASESTVVGKVVAAQLKRALLLGGVAGYVLSMRESTMNLLLHPPGGETLAVAILTQSANGSPGRVAAACVILAVLGLLPFPLAIRYAGDAG